MLVREQPPCMDIRQATTDDVESIRQVARRSLEASYEFLDTDLLEDAIDQWYDEEAVVASMTGAHAVVLVGTVDDEVVAFSQSVTYGDEESVGEIKWLHVGPNYRDEGVGRELLDRTCEMLRNQGAARIRGVVLAGNEAGSEFYEDNGFEHYLDRTVEIAGDEYEERVYEMGGSEPLAPGADIERRELDGETVYVFRDEGERGSEGMFHPVYRDQDRDDLYTWLCGVCGSTDNAMDTLGRLQCNECGNVLKPTRWDAAYL